MEAHQSQGTVAWDCQRLALNIEAASDFLHRLVSGSLAELVELRAFHNVPRFVEGICCWGYRCCIRHYIDWASQKIAEGDNRQKVGPRTFLRKKPSHDMDMAGRRLTNAGCDEERLTCRTVHLPQELDSVWM